MENLNYLNFPLSFWTTPENCNLSLVMVFLRFFFIVNPATPKHRQIIFIWKRPWNSSLQLNLKIKPIAALHVSFASVFFVN